MPNKWTFTIKPIKQLLDEEIDNPNHWVDPMAGRYSPAVYKNDINSNMLTQSHMDALDYLSHLLAAYEGVIYDPPYSNNQFRLFYMEAGKEPNKAVFNARWNRLVKDQMARIIQPGGKAICCGWNSMGLGKNRGFEMTRILLVPHGRQHNDTIVTVERKL